MKTTKILATGLLFFLLIFSLVGCRDANNNDRGAMRLLIRANENFKNLTSYMQAKYMLNVFDDGLLETKVKFTQPWVGEDGMIRVGSNHHFTMGFPYIIHGYEQLIKEKPTLLVSVTPSGEGKVRHMEYVFARENYLPFMDYERAGAEGLINRENLLSLLRTAAAAEKGALTAGMGVYTGGFFNMNVIPQRIRNLRFHDEEKFQNSRIAVLRGEVTAIPDEKFSLFDEAEVEIWIDTKRNLIIREAYFLVTEGKEADRDFYIFEYGYFNTGEKPLQQLKETPVPLRKEYYLEFFRENQDILDAIK